ncbi:nucleotidyl transferase AbiEii/AbiGii toxin family protein [Ferruginibacter sp.]|nr:nucleotidyl transferase AbiEii/AbiGii toxin family protein [Ferruginibacter sp.]
MLHVETVEPRTLSLLETLIALPELKDFHLVGGTALSLQYGHRTSVDLELFCINRFDNEFIKSTLQNKFGLQFEYESGFSKFGIFCYINGVKVDLVHYPHPIIGNLFEDDGIRMYDAKDIAAMKIQAILGRGKRKDFWDIATLSGKYSVKEMINFHKAKFPSQQLLVSIPQALTYFADAEESEDPVSLKGQTWETVKKTIQQKVNDYLK